MNWYALLRCIWIVLFIFVNFSLFWNWQNISFYILNSEWRNFHQLKYWSVLLHGEIIKWELQIFGSPVRLTLFGAIKWAEEMVQISPPFSCVLYILCPAFPMQCFCGYQMLTDYAPHKLWIAIILKWLLYQEFPTHINNSTSGVILDMCK